MFSRLQTLISKRLFPHNSRTQKDSSLTTSDSNATASTTDSGALPLSTPSKGSKTPSKSTAASRRTSGQLTPRRTNSGRSDKSATGASILSLGAATDATVRTVTTTTTTVTPVIASVKRQASTARSSRDHLSSSDHKRRKTVTQIEQSKPALQNGSVLASPPAQPVTVAIPQVKKSPSVRKIASADHPLSETPSRTTPAKSPNSPLHNSVVRVPSAASPGPSSPKMAATSSTKSKTTESSPHRSSNASLPVDFDPSFDSSSDSDSDSDSDAPEEISTAKAAKSIADDEARKAKEAELQAAKEKEKRRARAAQLKLQAELSTKRQMLKQAAAEDSDGEDEDGDDSSDDGEDGEDGGMAASGIPLLPTSIIAAADLSKKQLELASGAAAAVGVSPAEMQDRLAVHLKQSARRDRKRHKDRKLKKSVTGGSAKVRSLESGAAAGTSGASRSKFLPPPPLSKVSGARSIREKWLLGRVEKRSGLGDGGKKVQGKKRRKARAGQKPLERRSVGKVPFLVKE